MVLHAVTGVMFVVGLHDYINDETVLKFVITDDNKQLCYLDDLNLILNNNLCESYNVIVDVPTNHLQLFHPDKTNYSKENWNNKAKADLVRSSFDSTVKMLELSTDNKVIFVVERLNSDNLKYKFDNMKQKSAKLNELDLIKLKIPSASELSGIIVGNIIIYDERIRERFSCKICNEYDVPSFGCIPSAKPFQCLHYFHPQCVSNWKKWGLTTGNGSGPLNLCFYC